MVEQSNSLLVHANQVTVEIESSSMVVDTSEPLTGEPVKFEDGELAVRGQDGCFFIKTSGDNVLATKARSTTTSPRHRGTTYMVTSLEAEF